MYATMPVQALGKRQDRGSVAAATLGEENKLLYLTDAHSGRHFLVDTGPQKSFIRPTYTDRLARSSGLEMLAANGSDIKTFARVTRPTAQANVTATGGSTSVTSEFVKKDSDFLLYINESAIPENFLIFRWMFKIDAILISFLRGGDTEVSDSHSERIEFSKENHSVKLKRLQEADSGDYIARVSTPNKELTLVTYSIVVQEPVSPADLTVDHVSSSSHSCILTVTCSTGDSHISSNFTCDTRTCYQEGGEKPKVTASGAVLHLQLANQSIICNHSNQVSYEETPRNIRELCPNHEDKRGQPYYIIGIVFILLCGAALGAARYRQKRGKSDNRETTENTVYAVPDVELTNTPAQIPVDEAVEPSPTSTYSLVGPHTGSSTSTEQKPLPESLYAQVEKPHRI
ncbi:SLAM family member 7-like isoform 2-T2 [Pholidichthys leucotaenia]